VVARSTLAIGPRVNPRPADLAGQVVRGRLASVDFRARDRGISATGLWTAEG
jgi:hypothetical protein